MLIYSKEISMLETVNLRESGNPGAACSESDVCGHGSPLSPRVREGGERMTGAESISSDFALRRPTPVPIVARIEARMSGACASMETDFPVTQKI
jgi:hypothetical protein